MPCARELVARNVAHHIRRRRRPPARTAAAIVDRLRARPVPRRGRSQRLYPALHLAAHTGMRRGEIVGLKWSDLDRPRSRLSITRTCRASAADPSSSASRPAPAAAPSNSTTTPSTSSSAGGADSTRRPPARRRRLDVLQHTRPVPQPRIDQPALRPHRRTQRRSRASGSTTCATPTPRCSSPTASRSRSSSERLGHAHPAFTMHTYQHLLPGMSAAAADQFAALIATASR